MSKVHFDENELMIMAMFEQDTAENTKKELEEVLPYVADDMAVRLLVEQVISKMEICRMSSSRIWNWICTDRMPRKRRKRDEC